MMNSYLLAAIGGALGSVARYGLYRAFPGHGFALVTLSVNVAGSFLIGLLAAIPLLRGGPWGALLMTGVLGGFTTFSAFSLDAAVMWQRGDYATLCAYVIGSVALSIGALFLGMLAMRAAA